MTKFSFFSSITYGIKGVKTKNQGININELITLGGVT